MSLSATAHAAQVTATWTGAGANANWDNPANWSTANFPNNGTPAGTTYNVVIDGNSGATANVILNVIVTIDALTVNSGDSLAFNNGQQITVVNSGAGTGTIVNSGTIALNSGGTSTDLVINGNVTLSGGGTITLGNNNNNRIFGTVATDRLTNVDNTIQGAGQIGADFMALTNQGTIVANQSNTLTIDPSASGAINSATLRATASATLRLQGGAFTNTGATINAQNVSVVELTGATITNGTLTTDGTGVVRNIGVSTLSNLTNAGSFAGNNGTDTNLVGTITNTGTIALNSGGTSTDLILNGDVTLTGSGSVTLGNNINNRIFGAAAGDRLTNAAGHTIQGAGQIGANSMALTNAGNIIANVSNTLTIDPAAGGVSNSGTLEASSATLRLQDGAFTNTGNGLILARAASFVDLSGATITGPTLNTVGSGVIRNVGAATLANTTNAGNFAANNGTNTNLVGTITNNSIIALNSGGTSTDLIINGDVTLTGSGSVTMSNNINNRIFGLVNTDRLTNAAGHTIQGAGQIGADFMAFTNAGTVIANQSNTLTIDPSASGVINTATLRAMGGILRLQGGNFTNTGGTITAQDASFVDLTGATLSGGTLTTAGSGVVRNIATSTLGNLTNAGSFAANNGTNTNLVGTITNTGTIAVNSGGTSTDLIINGDMTLNGGGTVTFSNNINNRIFGATATDRLTNVDNTIQGAGQIGANSMALTNQGTIIANVSNTLTIDPSPSGAINSATLRATAGGTLTLADGGFTNTGGTITAQDASFVNLTGATLTGGTLTTDGSGVVRNVGTSTLSTLTNAGSFAANNGTNTNLVGTITNNGTIALNSGGSSTDLIINGNVMLTGSGSVTMSNNINNRIFGLANTDRLTKRCGSHHSRRGPNRR